MAATEEGVKRVREELAAPLTARYCDAELLFREPRRLGSGSTAYGLTDGGSGQVGLEGRNIWAFVLFGRAKHFGFC